MPTRISLAITRRCMWMRTSPKPRILAASSHGLFGLRRRRAQDARRVPVPTGHVARLELGLPQSHPGRRHAAREIPRRRNARIEEQARLGHRDLPSELINQEGEVVQKGEHKLMIPRRPTAAPRHEPGAAARRPSRVDYTHFLAGPYMSPLPRRAGRRGHQGRTPEGRRRGPSPSLFQGWPKRLFPAAEHGQAGTLHRISRIRAALR